MLSEPWISWLPPNVLKLLVAVALGMFLGLEREWSEKDAGIRTFALITLAGAVFTILETPALLIIAGVLVLAQGILLGIRGVYRDESGLSLTTSISMIVAFGVGILVASGHFIEGVIVALLSSMLLVLRRELHGFAQDLSKEEVRSASELAILAFVVYPLLPDEQLGPWNAINPRVVWLLVIAMSAIGFVNYIIIQKYGTRGIGVSGFVGGLVNSTAVVGEIATRSRRNETFAGLAVSGILLADAAMAFRNTLIILFFLPELALVIGAPLLAITIAGIALSIVQGNWDVEFTAELDSPFSLQSALKFGTLFLFVLVLSAAAQATFGSTGFFVTAFFSGLISSGSVATTAVVLVGSGQLSVTDAALGVVVATSASILVKIGFAATVDRSLIKPVGAASLVLIATGTVATIVPFLVA
ncbi:MgtC/SapB family protein [Natronosalvus vescus]|uniref:MgtC/SapB family protein n=1 Tax=Natronosalvus vescus TaxID=2953881 RepID=UPI0020908FF4|nr:MgtC/SapB family protein [Natronosalvus vescus]